MLKFSKIDHNDDIKIVNNLVHATTDCQFIEVWWPWKEEKEKSSVICLGLELNKGLLCGNHEN